MRRAHFLTGCIPYPAQAEELLIDFMQVFFLRSMLAVPYFEKALYELPEERVTPDELKAVADETERRIQGGLAGRCRSFSATPLAAVSCEWTFQRQPDHLFVLGDHCEGGFS